MRNGNPYIGSGRYIQTENAVGLLGSEMKRHGSKRAFILGGEKALSVSIDEIEKSIRAENINYVVEEFHGHCSLKKVGMLREKAERYNADMIVGVGGGKALDTAKLLADEMKLRVITIPTSAATCAATAVLSVIYSDDGDVLYNAFYSHEIASILVDTKIIASQCPPRMLASGIADALAKYPEIVFSMNYSTDWEKTVLPSAAIVLAKHNWDLLFQTGKKALEDAQASQITPLLEDVICTNIALTGMVSSLVSGGHQLGIAHFFHDAICKFFKAQQKKFLHGEIVSAGILLQMIVNRVDSLEIEKTRNFLKAIGTPVSLQDIDIEPESKNIEKIYSYIRTAMNLKEPWMNQCLRSGLEGMLSFRH